MSFTNDLMKSADHYRITEYTFEYRICGKNSFEICAIICRGVRISNINVNGINIQNKVLY